MFSFSAFNTQEDKRNARKVLAEKLEKKLQVRKFSETRRVDVGDETEEFEDQTKYHFHVSSSNGSENPNRQEFLSALKIYVAKDAPVSSCASIFNALAIAANAEHMVIPKGAHEGPLQKYFHSDQGLFGESVVGTWSNFHEAHIKKSIMNNITIERFTGGSYRFHFDEEVGRKLLTLDI
ncbi:MAG: hypothetical protein K9G62_03725 [Alphaproteobacteria bacterium]|nr:hypothetical protein [Alphaproteobacteria bacterium]